MRWKPMIAGGIAVTFAVLSVSAVWWAGRPDVIREPPPLPEPKVSYHVDLTRARQVLAAWVPAGLRTRWRTGLVLMEQYLTWADGEPDRRTALSYPRWRYRLLVPLPAGPRYGTVTFTESFTSLRVPLISAATAYQAILPSPPPPVCIDGPCAVFALNRAQLTTMDVPTSRGTAIVPVWQFTVAGSSPDLSETIDHIAVAPQAIQALPVPVTPAIPPSYLPVWAAWPDPSNPRRLIVELGPFQCAFDPRVYPVEAAAAIVLTATKTTAADPNFQGGSCQIVVSLRAPLGARVPIDAATGLPITRHQAAG
jgi:hypothetical protein